MAAVHEELRAVHDVDDDSDHDSAAVGETGEAKAVARATKA